MAESNNHQVNPLLEPVEVEILKLVAQGSKNEDIARQLSYSVHTIKWRLKEIFDNLEVTNRIEAINRAREMGILPPNSQTALSLEQPTNNPYRGLKTFQASDAAVFFGRETLVQQIVQRFSQIDSITPFLLIVGPSGIGKSSLINAGLIPQLNQGKLKGLRSIRLSDGYRAYYRIKLDEVEIVLVLEVNKHDYKKIERQVILLDHRIGVCQNIFVPIIECNAGIRPVSGFFIF